MTSLRPKSAAPASEDDRHIDALMLVQAGHGGRLTLVRKRRRDDLLARLRHRSLDRRLASGASPEGSRHLAARAAQLGSVATRCDLALRWEAVATKIRSQQADGRRPASPVGTHSQIAGEVERVGHALRSGRSASARGVALAVTLLPMAEGAVRRLALGEEDVVAAVARAALAELRSG